MNLSTNLTNLLLSDIHEKYSVTEALTSAVANGSSLHIQNLYMQFRSNGELLWIYSPQQGSIVWKCANTSINANVTVSPSATEQIIVDDILKACDI